MNLQISTVTLITVSKTELEWREVLVDPRPFQDALRAALAAQHTGDNWGGTGHAPSPTATARNGHEVKKPPFAKAKTKTKVTLPCPHCPKTFRSAIWLSRHQNAEHRRARAPVPSADEPSRA